MSEKKKEFEEEALEEQQTSDDSVKYEENDNWEFDGVAHTLEDTIENGEIEITFAERIKSENDDRIDKEPIVKKTPTATAGSKKKKSNAPKYIATAVIGVIVIALLAVFGVRYYTVPNTSEKMNPGNVAMTDGDEKVSIGMYNYYYNTIYQNYVQYAQYYNNLDTTKDFSKQKTTDGDGKETTWAKVFVNDTVDRLQYILALYQAGEKKGVTLTANQKETIKSNLDSIKTSAADSEVSVDEYISETYGDYCGYATLEKMLTQAYIANNYYRQYLIENRPTEDEINAYYKEHEADYQQVNFAYLPIAYEADNASALETVQKNAKKYAKQIKSVSDLKKAIPGACKDLIEQYVAAGYFEDADACAEAIAGSVETTITKSDTSFTEAASEWLFSEKTKKGACNTFTDESNGVVYIILKTSEVSISDEEVYSVRHILITPKKAETEEESEEEEEATKTTYTDEEWAEAKRTADNVLAEYSKGDKTELSFALLAEKYSDDTESTSNGSSGLYGGLYEGTKLGQMVPEFEGWATDKARKYGDVDIVKSDYGYHIMFFVEDTKYYLYDSEQGALSEKGEKFVDSFEVKKHKSAMKKTTVAKPESAEQKTDDASLDVAE